MMSYVMSSDLHILGQGIRISPKSPIEPLPHVLGIPFSSEFNMMQCGTAFVWNIKCTLCH